TVGGQLHYALSQRVKLTLRAGSNTDFTNNVLDGAVTGHFNSRRSVGGLQADIGVGTGLLSVGYDWEKQSLLSNLDYAVTGRIIRGAYAQWQASFGAQSVQANLRRDDNSQFGDRTTGSLLWGWELTETLRLTANYGTAFRAPSFNDLYFPGYGTATLKPESSRNLQLGLRGTPAWGRWSLEAYRNEIKNLIEFNAATYSPGNIGRARITGLEGVIGTKLADWNLSATATLMQAHDRTPGGANRGHTLPRRAERSAHFDADRRFGAFSVGASWQVAGRRFDDIGNQHPLGGYGLLNLRGGWQLAPAWHLDLALNNAFDKRYETAWYFNQPGRNFMLTLNWQPRD
ncbi:MAG TPA: TonB-dependent receptor, partial [Rhodanobacteraceae bacterium]|nr:TonB-dependent receptor [Rhodanobacteraceae bacterium]